MREEREQRDRARPVGIVPRPNVFSMTLPPPSIPVSLPLPGVSLPRPASTLFFREVTPLSRIPVVGPRERAERLATIRSTDICPICYVDPEEEPADAEADKVRLGCGHVFHRECLYTLIDSSETAPRCPACRDFLFPAR